jgi:penicillin-binding protein 1A
VKSVVTRWRSVVAAVAAIAPARGSPGQLDGSPWTSRVIILLTCGGIVAAAFVLATLLAVVEFHHVYFNRDNLPDLGLIELAPEHREIARYEDIPPIVRDAILAAEDKRFFSHNGIDYFSVPRVPSTASRGRRNTILAGGS